MKPQVLIVDDDPAIRALLRLVLTRAGFEIDTATDGAEALDLIQRNEYVIVLLDLMMPRLNGYDFIAAVRGFSPRPAVVVVTAMNDAFVQGLDPAVVHSIIRKPFDIEMITAIVTEMTSAIDAHRIEEKLVPFPHRKDAG